MHTNDVVPRVREEIQKINTDGSLPPGVKLVPFYDRTQAGRRHHRHGAAQPRVRLRADLPHSVDFSRRLAQRHHRRRQYPVRAVLQHHHSGAARRGRQPALGRRASISASSSMPPSSSSRISIGISSRRRSETAVAVAASGRRRMGRRSDTLRRFFRHAGLDRPAAAHSGQRAAGRQSGVLLHRDHRRRLHPAVHHAGRRRPDLRSDGADLCLRAGRRADWRPSR